MKTRLSAVPAPLRSHLTREGPVPIAQERLKIHPPLTNKQICLPVRSHASGSAFGIKSSAAFAPETILSHLQFQRHLTGLLTFAAAGCRSMNSKQHISLQRLGNIFHNDFSKLIYRSKLNFVACCFAPLYSVHGMHGFTLMYIYTVYIYTHIYVHLTCAYM